MAPKVKALTLKILDKLAFWSLLLVLVAVVFMTVFAGLLFISFMLLLLGELQVNSRRKDLLMKRAQLKAERRIELDKDLSRIVTAECAARISKGQKSIEVRSCT